MSTTPFKNLLIPSLFLSHGAGPAFFMKSEPGGMLEDVDETSASCVAFKNVGMHRREHGLPLEPKGIVVMSAHWEEKTFTVMSGSLDHPTPLYYDYYGFPASTYKLTYPATGDVELGNRVMDLIKKSGMDCMRDEERREGWDHGVFLPLKLLYPEAKVPVVQISLKLNLDPVEHYRVGQALQELRKEGVLVVGSGQATHPMNQRSESKDADKFMDWLNGILLKTSASGDDRMKEISKAFGADPALTQLMRVNHNPRWEHFIPLMFALGASNGAEAKDLFNKPAGGDYRAIGGKFSLASYLFGMNQEESVEQEQQQRL